MTERRGMIIRTHTKGDAKSEAVYSPCEKYRYRLDRIWQCDGRRILFVMLNPSTATEDLNDPTVKRCENRARALGFGALTVVNIFAWREPKPRLMRKVDDPVGPANDASIQGAAMGADSIVAAWGNNGSYQGRATNVEAFLRATNQSVHHLGLTNRGYPKHPLPVKNAQDLIHWF